MIKKKLDTYHGVPNCVSTSIPKFYFLKVHFNLAQGLRHVDCYPEICQFFGIELMKIYLIYSSECDVCDD